MTTIEPDRWRKSSFSGTNGSCVEVACRGDHVAVRNSNRPDAGTLSFSRTALGAFIDGCTAGELDHLGR